MPRAVRRWAPYVLLLACSETDRGTDTGNPPVIDLHTSACRERYGESKGLEAKLQSLRPEIVDDPLYDGLTCFVWQRGEGGSLSISLTNYETGCYSDKGWSPRVESAADGALELVLEDDQCAVAGCGSCLYDLSFTIDADDVAADREVRLFERGCDSSPTTVKRAALPLGSQTSGAVCTYTHAGALRGFGAFGGRPLAPCSEQQVGMTGDCPTGYTCTDVGAMSSGTSKDPRCLAVCASDADCDSLSSCTDGVCRLSATGLTSSSADGAQR